MLAFMIGYGVGFAVTYFIVNTILKDPGVIDAYNLLTLPQRMWATFLVCITIVLWPLTFIAFVGKAIFGTTKS